MSIQLAYDGFRTQALLSVLGNQRSVLIICSVIDWHSITRITNRTPSRRFENLVIAILASCRGLPQLVIG